MSAAPATRPPPRTRSRHNRTNHPHAGGSSWRLPLFEEIMRRAAELLASTAIEQKIFEAFTRALPRAVEAAIATVLQEHQQQKQQQQKKKKPAEAQQQLSEVEQQIAKAAAGPTKPRRSRGGFRGRPPPPSFDFEELPDSTLLTEIEAAAVGRWSSNTLSTWRKRAQPRGSFGRSSIMPRCPTPRFRPSWPPCGRRRASPAARWKGRGSQARAPTVR